MKILLHANLHEERLGASYLRAFRALGHEVIAVDSERERRYLAWWLRNRIGHRLSIRSLALRRTGSRELNRRFVRAVEDARPDLVLVLGGDFLMPESVRAARRTGAKVAVYFPDNPLPPHYASRPETLETAAECDLYLVWGEALARKLNQSGVPRATFLPFGWDPDAFPYQGQGRTKEYDVAFIGGWSQERELFLDEVGRHFRLHIWGPPYWATRTRPGGVSRRNWQGRALDTKEAAAVMAATRINLNILRDQHIVDGVPEGVIMRTFEAPGAGGFLLSTWTPTANRLFPEGESGAYFTDLADCIKRIEYFLTHAAQRNQIVQGAHHEVSERHLYIHRVKELEALLA